jgi:hypothetical protein
MITTGHDCIERGCPGLACYGFGSLWACAKHVFKIWIDAPAARHPVEGRAPMPKDARPSPIEAQRSLFG